MTKIFSGVTELTTDFTKEQNEFIEKLYQESLREVFGADGHGAFKTEDEVRLKEATQIFIDNFIKEEEGEKYDIVIATSPYDSRMKAKEHAGGDLAKVCVLNYPWISDFRFILLYEVLNEFDNLNEEEMALLQKNSEYKEILRSGIYDITVAYNDDKKHMTFFVAPTFSWVETDENGRLHSLSGPALAWRDGYKEYAILGIFFDEDVWKKIIRKEYTTKEVLTWKNDDEKAAILSVYGVEWLIESTNAKKIETVSLSQSQAEEGKFYLPKGAGEYHLYLVKNVFPENEYFIAYTCPSTGRKYFENIPPEEGKKGAFASMAWKFSTEEDDFKKMEYHA